MYSIAMVDPQLWLGPRLRGKFPQWARWVSKLKIWSKYPVFEEIFWMGDLIPKTPLGPLQVHYARSSWMQCRITWFVMDVMDWPVCKLHFYKFMSWELSSRTIIQQLLWDDGSSASICLYSHYAHQWKCRHFSVNDQKHVPRILICDIIVFYLMS